MWAAESRPNYRVWFKGGGLCKSLQKKEGDTNIENIYVCTCIWRLEITYLENKNGHGWVRLGGRSALGEGV